MTQLFGGITDIDTTEFSYEGTDFIWFSPIKVLASIVGDNSDAYDYWCRTCGSSWFPELYPVQQLMQRPAPLFECFTPQVISGDGLCNLAKGWLFSSFWSQVTGGVENQCGDPNLGGG